jgi:hypothetical protein
MKGFICKVLMAVALLWSIGSDAQPLRTSAPASASVREGVQKTYLSQVGVGEKTGRNDGKEVEMYLRSVGLGRGNPWCAAYVNWCLVQNGVHTCNSGWVPNWFPVERLVYRQGKVIQRFPAPGDCFGIYFSSKRRLAHIGFVDQWKEGPYAMCVEGNTSSANSGEKSREGDGVYRKYRLKSQIHSVSSWLGD